jgi:hypothetical protein
MASYHRMPIDRTNERFEELDEIAGKWPRARPPVQASSLERLTTYVQTLDEVHQRDFSDHVRWRLTATTGHYRRFWSRVSQDVLRVAAPSEVE